MAATGEFDEEQVISGRIRSEEQFRQAVKQYVSITDDLARVSKHATTLRKAKTEMTALLLKFMQDNGDIEELDLSGEGKLLRRKSRRVEGIKKDGLVDQLGDMLGDRTKAEVIISSMWNNRPVVESWTLRRTRPRAAAAADGEA